MAFFFTEKVLHRFATGATRMATVLDYLTRTKTILIVTVETAWITRRGHGITANPASSI